MFGERCADSSEAAHCKQVFLLAPHMPMFLGLRPTYRNEQLFVWRHCKGTIRENFIAENLVFPQNLR